MGRDWCTQSSRRYAQVSESRLVGTGTGVIDQGGWGMLAIAGTGYGLIGILAIVLIVVLIIAALRRA